MGAADVAPQVAAARDRRRDPERRVHRVFAAAQGLSVQSDDQRPGDRGRLDPVLDPDQLQIGHRRGADPDQDDRGRPSGGSPAGEPPSAARGLLGHISVAPTNPSESDRQLPHDHRPRPRTRSWLRASPTPSRGPLRKPDVHRHPQHRPDDRDAEAQAKSGDHPPAKPWPADSSSCALLRAARPGPHRSSKPRCPPRPRSRRSRGATP